MYPVLVFRRDTGRHQRRIEIVTKKQMPEAMTSGNNTA
jgi:hypothetical protein